MEVEAEEQPAFYPDRNKEAELPNQEVVQDSEEYYYEEANEP